MLVAPGIVDPGVLVDNVLKIRATYYFNIRRGTKEKGVVFLFPSCPLVAKSQQTAKALNKDSDCVGAAADFKRVSSQSVCTRELRKKKSRTLGLLMTFCFPAAPVLIIVAPGSTSSVNTCILTRDNRWKN